MAGPIGSIHDCFIAAAYLGAIVADAPTGCLQHCSACIALSKMHRQAGGPTPYNNTRYLVIRTRDGQFVEVTEYMDTALIDPVFGER